MRQSSVLLVIFHTFLCEGRPRILRSIHDLAVTCSLLVSLGKCTVLDFSVAVLFLMVDVPVGRLCRFFVALCVKTVEIPQLRLVVFFRQ